MKYILFPQDRADRDQLGGKAAALQALHTSALPIPPWFVLSPQACLDSLTSDQKAALAHDDSVAPLGDLVPSPDVLDELTRALERLDKVKMGEGEIRVAVRSSALDEDGAMRAFAGQLESFLSVLPQDVGAAVAAVWCSAFSARVRAYRAAHGLTDIPQPPAVLVQQMIQADRAGVAFSADPATGQRGVAVVEAVFGLGSTLVNGETDADVYRIDRNSRLISCDIAVQEIAHEADPASRTGQAVETGTRTVVLAPEAGGQQTLTEQEAVAVAGLVRQAEKVFGRPQDIEWAIERTGGSFSSSRARSPRSPPPQTPTARFACGITATSPRATAGSRRRSRSPLLGRRTATSTAPSASFWASASAPSESTQTCLML